MQTQTSNEEIISFAEACEMVGISYRTGLRHLRGGTFPVPVRRFGRRMVLSRAAVLRYVEGVTE